MKIVWVILVLLSFVAGAGAATGDVGATCSTGDLCTDTNAYCDTTDANNKVCRCNTGWVAKGTLCVRGANQPCDASQCLQNGVCNSGSCSCDTNMGYAAGTSGDASCSCPASHAVRASDSKCAKVIDQACTADTECIDNAKCDSSLCKCDTTKYFAVGTAGATTCSCDNTKAVLDASSGKCLLKHSQTCSADTDCVSTSGMKCISSSCGCDTTQNYAAGTAGDTTCSCDATKAVLDATSGKCLLKHSQTCTADADCVSTDGMKCVSGSCGCDTTKKFAAGSSGDTTCTCDTNYALKADKTCGLLSGQTCTAGTDTCVDHATCSTTCTCDTSWSADANNLCVCTPATHTLKSDGTCGKIIGQTCAADSECMDNAKCVSTQCTCDATANRDATTAAGATSCPCDANSVETNGVCYKKVGQTCSAASECIQTPGMVCQSVSGTIQCTCDTSKNYAAGSAGDVSCSCDANSVATSGVCYKKVGQTCSAASECIQTPGMVCQSVSGTVQCTCDTSKYYAAGSAGDTSCSCASADYYKKSDGSCVLTVGKTCSATGAPCIMGAVCDKKTLTCLCDTSNNYKAGTTGATSCACADNAVQIPGTSYCGLKVGGTCTAKTDANVCTDNASCSLDSALNRYLCACSGTAQTDGTCSAPSGVSGVVASLALLTAGLLLTSQMI